VPATQTAEDYIKGQAEAKLTEANEIAKKAADEGRAITSDERKRVEGLLEDVSTLKVKLDEIGDNAKLTELVDKMNASFTAPVVPAPESAKSIGDAVVLSEQYQALKANGFSGKWTTGPIELPGFGPLGGQPDGAKATVTETASPIVTPDFRPGITDILFRRLTIADLLATGTTESNQVTYAQETTATNAAAATLEADPKPESTIILALVNEAVRKIATFLPVSDEMLEDVAQARSYLDSRLRLFVQHTMEAQLLNGTGTAPQIRGLLNRTGVQTVTTVTPLTAAKIIEAIYDAITLLRTVAFLEPDAVVVNPTNWAMVRKEKDLNGQYYGGGPFIGPYGVGGIAADNIWTLPVVVTGACPAGTALVGAFRAAAQVFLKSGLTVEASNSHADFFQKDLTAIRAEQRAALAVYRPNGFVKITLTA
jgi:HK97 family phage major capsid protein